jgi:hypothetical protein
MHRRYHSPRLIEYGGLHALTRGGSAPNSDSLWNSSGQLVPNPNNPDCFTDVPYGACYPTSGPGSQTQPIP